MRYFTREHIRLLVGPSFLIVFGLLIFCSLLVSPTLAHSEQEETNLQVVVDGRQLELRYTTEFPRMGSFARLRKMDRNGDEAYSPKEREAFLTQRAMPYKEKARVLLDDQSLALTLKSQEARISETLMGLDELAVVYVFETQLTQSPGSGSLLTIEDSTFGWNTVELLGAEGEITGDTPGDALTITFGTSRSTSVTSSEESTVHSDDELMNLVSGELTPQVIMWTLGLAFVLGAIHALTPGHGKTMVAAYLVGSRGTVGQAILLGIVVTITHTASVFLLGLACLFAFQYVVPDKIIPWLGFLSGILITAVGLALIYARATGRELFHGHSHENGHGHSHGSGHGHSHDSGHQHTHNSSHAHSHDCDHAHQTGEGRLPPHHIENVPQIRVADDLAESHTHSHALGAETDPNSGPVQRLPEEKEDKVSLWALISLGVSGGMVPCPEALMVLLGAISLNRLLLGMAVLVSFSAGLASLLIIIGILVVTASNRVSKKYYPSDATIKRISIAAYSFICLLGLVIAVRSLTSAGILVVNL